MALIATRWHQSGRLRGGGIVATVLSNLGLERYLSSLDLGLLRTRVGDRYVVEHMRAKGCNVGGEQSGHIVLSDFGTTGDGLVAALQVMAAVKQSDKPVSQVTQLFTPLPQVQRNARYGEFNPLDSDQVRQAIAEAMSRLDQNGGRLLVRPSGTEPLIRVMAEGEDPSLIGKLVDELVSLIEKQAA